jgi:hypothetical protein
MKVGRRNELAKTWFRSDPVFSCNGQWYFHTREGIDVGPYDSQLEAEVESGMLRQLLKRHGMENRGREVLRDFILDSFTMGRPLSVLLTEEAEPAIRDAVRAMG